VSFTTKCLHFCKFVTLISKLYIFYLLIGYQISNGVMIMKGDFHLNVLYFELYILLVIIYFSKFFSVFLFLEIHH